MDESANDTAVVTLACLVVAVSLIQGCDISALLSRGLSFPLTTLLVTQCQHTSDLTYTRAVLTLHLGQPLGPTPTPTTTTHQFQHTQPNGTADPTGLKYNHWKFLSLVMELIGSRRTIDGHFSEGSYSLYIMSGVQ